VANSYQASGNLDGVVKSPIYCVVAGREMLGILYVCLRFRATPCIWNFLLSHRNRGVWLFTRSSTL